MGNLNFLATHHEWRLYELLGIKNTFFILNGGTLYATWMVCFLLIITTIIARYFLSSKKSMVRYIALTGIKNFIDLCTQTLGRFYYGHVSFFVTLFLFILYCNLMGLIPFLEEPTADLNTTLALGLISFLYVNYYGIKERGIKGYLHEFIQPFFVMFPLHVIGKLATIVSISFRLFGNLLGGAVIMELAKSTAINITIKIFTGLPLYLTIICSYFPIALMTLTTGVSLFFGVFEGLIQAFVFTMLSLTYLSIEIQKDEPQ